MALNTYADVQASIALWLNRNDLADVIPDFIRLCESDLNRRLRVPQNEAMETAYAVTGRYTALPSDFAEMRRLFLNYGAERLELVPAPQAGRVADGGVPFAYNIVNNKLEIVPESTAYTLELSYWKTVPALASNTAGTPVLTTYPDVYLYGSCVQAGYFLDDMSVTSKFEPKYERALQAANAKRFRQMGTGLQVRAS